MSRNMRALEERNAALVSQLRAYEQERRGQ